MMSARARAHIALRDNRPKVALAATRKGLEDIQAFFQSFGDEKMQERSGEIAVLRALEKDIEGKLPIDPIQKLRQQLADAVAAEQYERAAQLRDQIQRATNEN
jgi:protein-arginine kinase activator protein McsA